MVFYRQIVPPHAGIRGSFMKETNFTIRKTPVLVFVSTFLFGLAAHAFRYFSMGFSHDSVYNICQDDAQWQISLGRFLQPAYILLRGRLCAPFLMGLFSLFWLAVAVCLVVALLEIKSPAAIVLVCGMLSTNAALSLSNATYLYSSDVYMLALLFGVLGVFLQRRYKFGFLFGALFVSASLALYQSYFEVAVFLSLVLLVKDCLDRLCAKDILLRGLKALGMLLLGLIFYFVCLKIVLALTGVDSAATYNGIAGVGDYSDTSVLKLLAATYVYSGKYLIVPRTFHPVFSAVVNVLIAALSAAAFIKTALRRKLPKSSVWLLVVFILLMPFALNIVYFISKGLKHELMSYSFFFIYVFALMIFEYGNEDVLALQTREKLSKAFLRRNLTRTAVLIGIGVLILNNIIYANHLYLKKELEYEATLSTMTRVVDRMEQTEGYVVGETPVVIVGSLVYSELSVDRPGFEYINAVGMNQNYSLTYAETYSEFFEVILGYPIDLITDAGLENEYASLPEVQAMPSFPALGSCAMVGGVLVVKLS